MSTTFRTEQTDEWVGVRWGKGPVGCTGFDWGRLTDATIQRLHRLYAEQPNIVDESGSVWTWQEFREGVLDLDTCTWTFGQFGGTMEVGSGDIATWEGF